MRIETAGGDVVHHLFRDHLNGTIAIWTPSTSTVEYQLYYPYGETRDPGTLNTAFGYTGQRNDTTGLMYYNARYYDPSSRTTLRRRTSLS